MKPSINLVNHRQYAENPVLPDDQIIFLAKKIQEPFLDFENKNSVEYSYRNSLPSRTCSYCRSSGLRTCS